MNTYRQIANQYHVEADFYQLVNAELLPDSVNADAFWDSLSNILQQYAGDFEPSTGVSSHTSISLLHPENVLKALNARWGSLLSALYHEHTIPHSAGLKPGARYNKARGIRVTSHAKEFLDSAFPLTEGSHKDAVSYLVYFQNLMVILADGSTTGLQSPTNFVAKSGPRCDPDSIILRNQAHHVEICFDGRGVNGSQDIARIEDIHVEAPANTVISLRANNMTDKCQTYKNFLALIKDELKVSFDRNGKHHLRHLKHRESYTAKDGNNYDIQGCNPMVLQLDRSNTLMAICDDNSQPVSSELIDCIIASLIMLQANNDDCLTVSLMAADSARSSRIRTVLQQLSVIPGMPAMHLNLVTRTANQSRSTKESAQSADDMPPLLSCIDVAEEELKNTVTMTIQNGAVLKAIHHFSA